MVNIGQLNKRISIVKIVKEKDADGYWSESDVLVHSTWARYAEKTNRELALRDADYGEVISEFLIRETTKPISRKMIVLYRNDRYEIQSISPYRAANGFLLITAKCLTMEG